MNPSYPRLMLGADRGGSGKTMLSLGLLGAWRARGRSCAAFKKGPDYIDSAWLTVASGRPCRNLDVYLMGPCVAARSFADHGLESGVNLIEGNRGLFDGVDVQGSFSTAELAKNLDCPVILIVNCEKQTRTGAAFLLGCGVLDPQVKIAGVILNRVATVRQSRVVREAIETAAGIKVFGVIPRLTDTALHERHLGLRPPQELERPEAVIEAATKLAETYLDVEGLWRLAQEAPGFVRSPQSSGDMDRDATDQAKPMRIGYFHDQAFHFYYQENLEDLEQHGATLVAIDTLNTQNLPEDLDGLYIGGGFPEEHAAALAANRPLRDWVRTQAGRGLPIYAECAGLIYLGERLITSAGEFPMAGVFPVSFVFEPRPQGHGYVQAVTTAAHPFLPAGSRLKGHEFHYTRPVAMNKDDLAFAFNLERGCGLGEGRDGLVYKNTLATYLHVHALGERQWAPSLIRRCRQFGRGHTQCPEHELNGCLQGK